MKLHLLLAALCFTVSVGYSQKIDLDKVNVLTKMQILPEKELGADVTTFAVELKGESNLSNWGFNPEKIQKDYGILYGFQQTNTNPQLKWTMTMAPINFVDYAIKNRSETYKDKTGRETITTYYWYELMYVKGFTSTLTNEKGDVLAKYESGYGNRHTHKSSESTNYESLRKEYNEQRQNVEQQIARSVVGAEFGAIFNFMNRKVGYMPYENRFIVWETDSPKHPESNEFAKNTAELKRLFSVIKADKVEDSIKNGLEKIATYYKGVAEKYTNPSEKAEKKLRYASYLNMAQLYLHLDRFDESAEWAKKVIENDYDKKDGEKIIKEIAEVKKDMARINATSRRIQRGNAASATAEPTASKKP
jgi:hypothetical protein